MRPSITPKVTPRITPRITIRHATREYLALLSTPQAQLMSLREELEHDPRFELLEKAGVLRKVHVRGRIPPHRRAERDEAQALQVLVQHHIADRPGWAELFATADAQELSGLAQRFGITQREAALVQRYARGDQLPPARRAETESEEFPARETSAARGSATARSAQALDEIARFVEQYGLSAAQFEADFLWANADSAQLSEKHHVPRSAIEKVLQQVERFLLLQTESSTPPVPESTPPETVEVVAGVEQGEAGPVLVLSQEGLLGRTYQVDSRVLDASFAPNQRRELRAFVSKLRGLDVVSTLLFRTVMTIFREQRAHFASGSDSDLRPLSQASVARSLGVPPSSVSRALRGRALRTPQGVTPLAQFCQGRGEVVRRLCREHPTLSDAEIARLLWERHGCRLSRRTIGYHRVRREADA